MYHYFFFHVFYTSINYHIFFSCESGLSDHLVDKNEFYIYIYIYIFLTSVYFWWTDRSEILELNAMHSWLFTHKVCQKWDSWLFDHSDYFTSAIQYAHTVPWVFKFTFCNGKKYIKNMPSDPKIKYQGKKIERHKKRDNHFVSQKDSKGRME